MLLSVALLGEPHSYTPMWSLSRVSCGGYNPGYTVPSYIQILFEGSREVSPGAKEGILQMTGPLLKGQTVP